MDWVPVVPNRWVVPQPKLSEDEKRHNELHELKRHYDEALGKPAVDEPMQDNDRLHLDLDAEDFSPAVLAKAVEDTVMAALWQRAARFYEGSSLAEGIQT